jgi:hypothetical protein
LSLRRLPNAEVESAMIRLALGVKGAVNDPGVFRRTAEALKTALAGLDGQGFQEAFSVLLGMIAEDRRPTDESQLLSILLTVLGVVGQRHDTVYPRDWPAHGARLKTASGADLVLEVRRVSGVELKKTPGQDEPGRMDIPLARLSRMMRKAAREALAFMEDWKYSMHFMEGGDQIHKAALVIGGRDNVLIVFEEARNWRLVEIRDEYFRVRDS